MLEIVFWASVAIIVYTYFGFPLLLFVRSRLFRRPPQSADITPSITMVIVAHNEAAVIGSRLDNVLTMDYPRERMSVLVASDGSDDGTDEIVAGYARQGIRLLRCPRGGKVATLNAAAVQAQGDILVFSDANTLCASDALRRLVRPFADPRVGGVAGHQLYSAVRTSSSAEFGERAYWSFDQAQWNWQSAAGTLTTTTGALYAMRRSLFEPIPPGIVDDGANSFRIIERGYRIVYEPNAIAMECVAPSWKSEFRRKVRLCAMAFATVYAFRKLLNPWRYGFFSLQLFSHKILRWMIPWPLLGLFLSSLLLSRSSPFYAIAFLLQAVFYAMALMVAITPEPMMQKSSLPKAFTLPFYFCLAYAGSLRAQWNTVCGRIWYSWDATPRVLQMPERASEDPRRVTPGKVAYIMSRFPKITETFVLYEIIELRKRGEAVEIYPLIRERQPVAHPDVERLSGCVHFVPWISRAVVRANWHYLRRSPRVYLRTAAEAVRRNLASARLLLGALTFFPKSAAFAYEMERGGITHIHAHFATHPALSAWIIHRLTGIPYSFTAHAHDIFVDRAMLREKLADAAFVVAISEHNRNFMAEKCGEELRNKIHVVHCGVDVEYFAPPATPQSTGPLPFLTSQPQPVGGPVRMLCVASLLEMKGHAYLIEACRLLRQRGIDFHCDFVGDGERKAQLREQISRSGLDGAFTFLGPQPRSVVRGLLHQAQVKVLASVPLPSGLQDGIPVALMEAAACGVPVVSTTVSGIPELVDSGVNGILVPPRDACALAEALERLARDPELRTRMGRRGREKVLREFNLAANAERLASLFAGTPPAGHSLAPTRATA